MKMRFTRFLAATLALTGSLWALPEAETIDAAIQKASAENRTVIIEFTGRDWCTACMHLHNKIFSSPEFDAAVSDQYVVTELDYPRDPKLLEEVGPEEMARREHILQTYGLVGMPSVVLLDSHGLPFAIIVGTRRTPEMYLAELASAQKVREARDAALADAQEKTGLEKAKALADALELLPKTCRDKYTDVLAEIATLDPENTLGYNGLDKMAELRANQAEELREFMNSFVGRTNREEVSQDLPRIDAYLERTDLLPEIRQRVLMLKSDCCAMLGDVEQMLQCTKDALKAAPDTRDAPKLRGSIEYTEEVLIPRLREEAAKKAGK